MGWRKLGDECDEEVQDEVGVELYMSQHVLLDVRHRIGARYSAATLQSVGQSLGYAHQYRNIGRCRTIRPIGQYPIISVPQYPRAMTARHTFLPRFGHRRLYVISTSSDVYSRSWP